MVLDSCVCVSSLCVFLCVFIVTRIGIWLGEWLGGTFEVVQLRDIL